MASAPKISIEEAQAQLPSLIHGLAIGDDIVITEDNQVVARLTAERQVSKQRPGPGLCKGMITILADDDEHLADFAEYMQ